MKKFYLEVLSGGKPKKVEVQASLTLGRSRQNDLAFTGDDSGIVSARHALVAVKGHSLWLRDLDSMNGTFVGKIKVSERELLGGEVISLGPDGPALRVEVADLDADAALRSSAATVMAKREDVGLLAEPPRGNTSLILEMSAKLRNQNAPQDLVNGIMSDPDRLARLMRGGVMPEKVADWLGDSAGSMLRSRRRLLWGGGVLGALALAALTFLVIQNLGYRSKLKRQGDLLSQIVVLEKGLEGMAGDDPAREAEKSRTVHKLLSVERQLFQIREKLKIPDRVRSYRMPLGSDVHQVLEELGKKGFMVPESFIRSVQGQIDFFTRPGNRATVERCFARKPKYERLIRRELERLKLPADFLYIAMQESLLDPGAQSQNDARGLWQFVPVTAREYDLKVPEDWKGLPASQDERTDPRRSTRAAAQYLHLLYSEFGDAALAMAAYNAGAAKMRRVLRKIEDPVNDRDFWYLYRMGLLPGETIDYVPKIIAMILIDRDRKKYGFSP